MADRVYETQEITIGEGKDAFEATIKTNTIARQRRFMKQWDKNGEEVEKAREQYEAREKEAKENGTEFDEEFNVDQFDGYINLCGIALEKILEDKVEDMYDGRRKLTKEYREYLEENLDEKTILEIIRVCGGINLVAMMEAVQDIQSQLDNQEVDQAIQEASVGQI